MPQPAAGRGSDQNHWSGRSNTTPTRKRQATPLGMSAPFEVSASNSPTFSTSTPVGVGCGGSQDATTIAAAAAALRAAVGPVIDIFAPGQRNMRPRGVMRRPTSPAYRDHVGEVVFGGSSGKGVCGPSSSRAPSPRASPYQLQLQLQLQQQQEQQQQQPQQRVRGATPPPPPRSLSERARRRRIVGGPGIGPGLSREASPSEWRCLSAAGRSIDDIEEEADRQVERESGGGVDYSYVNNKSSSSSSRGCPSRLRSRTPGGCRASNIVPVHFGATPTDPLPARVTEEEWPQQRRASPRVEAGQAGASSGLINQEPKPKAPGECYGVRSSWPAMLPQCFDAADLGDYEGLDNPDGLTNRHKRLFKTQHQARSVNIIDGNQDGPEVAEPDASYKAMFEEHAGAPTWTVRASRPKPRSLSASAAGGDDRAPAGRPTSAQQACAILKDVRRRGRVPAGHPAKGWADVVEGAQAQLTTPVEVSPVGSQAPRPGSPVAGDSRGMYWWAQNRGREPNYAGSDTAVPDSYPLERPPFGTVQDGPLPSKKGKRLPTPYNYAPNSVSSLKDVVFNGKERCEKREPWCMSSSRSASTRVESHVGGECCIEVEDGISLRGSSTAPSLVSVIIREAEGKVAGTYHGHIVRQEDSFGGDGGGASRVVVVRRSRSSASGSAAGGRAMNIRQRERDQARDVRSQSSVGGDSHRQESEVRRCSNQSCGSRRQNPNFGSSNVGDLIFCGMG